MAQNSQLDSIPPNHGPTKPQSQLYTISEETKKALNDFKRGTSRTKDPRIVICDIDPNSQQIRLGDTVYDNLEELTEDLPNSSSRFILLSHPVQTSEGRLVYPYVMLHYLPVNCTSTSRMAYVCCRDQLRNAAGVSKVLDVEEASDIMNIPDKLVSDR